VNGAIFGQSKNDRENHPLKRNLTDATALA